MALLRMEYHGLCFKDLLRERRERAHRRMDGLLPLLLLLLPGVGVMRVLLEEVAVEQCLAGKALAAVAAARQRGE